MSTIALNGLLDIPVEIIDNIVQHLPMAYEVLNYLSTKSEQLWREDQLSLACCSRSLYRIIAPTLYYALHLNFRDDQAVMRPGFLTFKVRGARDIQKENSGPGGVDLPGVESMAEISNATMGYVREFHVKALYITQWNGHPVSQVAPQRNRAPVSEADHTIVRLLLKRVGTGQLLKIRFQHATSEKTLSLILERQTNITELELGDFLLDPGYAIPPALLCTGRLKLASLEVAEISQAATPLLVKLINLCAPTLKNLRFGDPNHPTQSRFYRWYSYRRDSPFQDTDVSEIVQFTKLELAVLERFHIVHDAQFGGFTRVLVKMLYGCVKLRQLRLSGCSETELLLSRLVNTGSKDIKTIQICYCNYTAELDGMPRLPVQAISQSDLRSPDSLGITPDTVQLTSFSHKEKYPEWIDPKKVKRLWLGCQYRCLLPAQLQEIGVDTGSAHEKCTPTEGLFDFEEQYAGNMSLTSENWPLLEELAIPNPGWNKLPTIPKLKILRLTQGGTVRVQKDKKPNLDKIVAYLDRLYMFSMSQSGQPPALRILVVETDVTDNHEYYTDACNQDLVEKLFHLIVDFGSTGNPSAETESAGLYRPSAIITTEEVALRLCHQVGCSSYLTLPGQPSPERFWEDA